MEASKVRYPIGIQSFEKIRTGKYAYVDKTALVHHLANNLDYVFLSRPRRFGKSLLLSTLQAYFEGRRELFEGLAIDRLETDWKRYPVIMFSLSGYNPNQEGNLEAVLDTNFRRYEEEYNVSVDKKDSFSRFHNIIMAAYQATGERVVVLVDEYDAPMVAHLGDEDRLESVRNLLKSIYVNLKDLDAYIRFGMLTGVSRFSKMTIFSGLNNIKDISLDDNYSTICGITEQELKDNFKEGVSRLGSKLGIGYDDSLLMLKDNYDGYHFTGDLTDIYNPFSLLNALADSRISSYWFASGTPTFLIKQIWRNPGLLSETFSEDADEGMLTDIDSCFVTPVALMFQTGYLTIKDYDPSARVYRLGIPNKEVEEGLFKGLLAVNTNGGISILFSSLLKIRSAVLRGDVDDFLGRIRSFMAAIPYSLTQGKPEIYFENNLYLLFMLVGINARAEWQTSRGRIDMLLETQAYIYVMELKLDGTPEQALAQIDTRDYTIPFSYDGREIIKVGLNFSSATRNIDTWLIDRPSHS